MALKHIGRLKRTQRKVAVAYRTVPGEAENCIVVTTENLMAEEHDTLMQLIESNAGQTANELADAMARTVLPDGRNMLAGFHTTGKMIKIATNEVEMTPDMKTTISLDELNKAIAQQKGVSIDDLAVRPSSKAAPETASVEADPVSTATEALVANESEILSDDQIAAKYRSDADRLYKEAKRLREEAEKLSPTKKKSKAEESA